MKRMSICLKQEWMCPPRGLWRVMVIKRNHLGRLKQALSTLRMMQIRSVVKVVAWAIAVQAELKEMIYSHSFRGRGSPSRKQSNTSKKWLQERQAAKGPLAKENPREKEVPPLKQFKMELAIPVPKEIRIQALRTVSIANQQAANVQT